MTTKPTLTPKDLINLQDYPLNAPDSLVYDALIKRVQADLTEDGSSSMPRFRNTRKKLAKGTLLNRSAWPSTTHNSKAFLPSG